jgi:hypothetical protein
LVLLFLDGRWRRSPPCKYGPACPRAPHVPGPTVPPLIRHCFQLCATHGHGPPLWAAALLLFSAFCRLPGCAPLMSVVLHRCLFAPSSFECFLELLMTLVGFLFFASEVECEAACLQCVQVNIAIISDRGWLFREKCQGSVARSTVEATLLGQHERTVCAAASAPGHPARPK